MKSSTREIIRVESEEMQDDVREAKSAEQEEVEERICVPSAVSVPQKLMFRCDKQCSEKTLGYWQLASVVISEGEESYTTNLCHMCFDDSLKAKGEKPLTNVQWRQVVEKKTYRGRIWRMMGKEPYVERNRVKRFREQAEEKSRQEYKVSGSWDRQPENTWSK